VAGTTIVVPTPEAEPAVAALRFRHDVWARRGFASHVTVALFLPEERVDRWTLERLHAIAAEQPPTTFSLTRVLSLPGAVLLVPEPRDPFRELRLALEREWPLIRRRPSLMRRVIGPHLTVARTFDPVTIARLARELAPQLPISVEANEAQLFKLTPDVQLAATLPFLRPRTA
jgi:2'-5' RNA ligase